MSALVIMNSQRMDLRCQLKDADEIINAFNRHHVSYKKKYTSIKSGQPSTITFVGIRGIERRDSISDMIADVHNQAGNGAIGNVYILIGERKSVPRKETSIPRQEYSLTWNPNTENANDDTI